MWTHGSSSSGVLSWQQCLRLLDTPGSGLLNLTRHPLAEPVRLSFQLVAEDLLLRPAPAPALLAALMSADVVLEVDATDDRARSGWHVVVVGRVEPTGGGHLVLRPSDVSGFRLVPTRSA